MWRSGSIFLITLFSFSSLARAEGPATGLHAIGAAAVIRAPGRPEGTPATPPKAYGVIFSCDKSKIEKIKQEMKKYLAEMDISEELLKIIENEDGTEIQYGLNTPEEDTSTIDIDQRPEYKIKDEELTITNKLSGASKKVTVASKKEILLALMQHGRSFPLKGEECEFEYLKDHVGMRQQTAAAARVERDWRFATGSNTSVNDKFWIPGWEIKPGKRLADGLADAYTGETDKYRMACTRECQLHSVRGPFAYFDEVKNDQKMVQYLTDLSEGEPLYKATPAVSGKTIVRPGKYLTRQFDVPWNNLIPGDWIFLRNPDEESSDIPGQEGKNTVVIKGNALKRPIGGSEFTAEGAVKEVYSWRSYSKQEPWTKELYEKMRKDPRDGGLLRDVRDAPRVFVLPDKYKN